MSFSEFVESPAYKKVMGKVYGLGAAVVILGALWKILHLPGATAMLIAGLGTEAIIFGLSAFEPPHEMPDWSLVYPELVGLEPNVTRHGGGGGGGGDLAALVKSGNIDAADVKKLSEGIKKLSVTTSQLSDISDASMATESYLQNMKLAGDSVGELANTQIKSAKAIDESVVQLTKVYNETSSVVGDSGKRIAESYANASTSMKENLEKVTANNAAYNDKLADVTKNIGALNSAYELQLAGINSQIQNSKSLASGLENVSDLFIKSAEDVKVYKEQVSLLSKNVTELNSIYGNMLSAMNMGKR